MSKDLDVSNSRDKNDGLDARVQVKRRRGRSIAIALALGGMAILFYAATIVHLGGNVLNRPM